MNGEIYLKGTLSFALAHTQACYKDSEPFTLFTYRGFLFKFQWPKNENKQGEAVNQSITQSISGTSKILTPSSTVILMNKITEHALSVYPYTFLLH